MVVIEIVKATKEFSILEFRFWIALEEDIIALHFVNCDLINLG